MNHSRRADAGVRSDPAQPEPDPSRLYPAAPRLAVSVAAFREGRLLVASRTRAPARGLYSLPGGLVELGETLEAAALRELQEEVGVTAELVGPAGHVDVLERDEAGRVRRHVAILAFAAHWRAGEAIPGPEAGDVRWVTRAELAFLPTTDGLQEIAARAARLLAGMSAAASGRDVDGEAAARHVWIEGAA